ncbi:MAG: hypothetical protein IPO91_00630 [Chloroflexi bacterium]|nr:hypothetical protein [Chloroflexota bacterium]
MVAIKPLASVTLGNLQYTEQAVAITATLALLPAVNAVTVTLPAGVRFEAAPDDDGVLELDSGDADGAGADTIVTGKVRAIRRTPRAVEATIGDAGAELARYRPAGTYEKSSAADVIRALAGEADASVASIDIDLPLAAYVAHQARTAAEHVATLAAWGGGFAGVNGDGELFVMQLPEGQPELALRWGRELIDYEVRELPSTSAKRLRVGFGTAGSESAPEALRPSVDPLPADSPTPGMDAIWMAAPALRVPKAAATASAAADAFAAAEGKRVRARCYLQPQLRPGMVIEVQDTPDGLSGGPWIITRVTHRLRPAYGGLTTFEAVTGEGGGLGDLLAAALGALGSLF